MIINSSTQLKHKSKYQNEFQNLRAGFKQYIITARLSEISKTEYEGIRNKLNTQVIGVHA